MNYPVNLKQSIDTSELDQAIKAIGQGEARVMTGIERDGGLTNLYRQDNAVTANAKTIITDSGKVLQVGPTVGASNPVSINGSLIGNVLSAGVYARSSYAGAADAAITATGTILVLYMTNDAGGVLLEERATDGTLIASRVLALLAGSTGARTVSIVREAALSYAANLEVVFTFNSILTFPRRSIEGGADTVFTMGTTIFPGAPYVYKYENANSYIVLSPGNNICAVGNIAGGGAVPTFTGTYCVLQVSGGFSRHIVTKIPALNAGLIECVGIVGHNAFTAVFTAAPVWQTPGGMAATAVDSFYRLTYGGVESFYTQAGLVRSLISPDPGLATAIYDRATGDITPVDYFGQVACNFGAGGGAAIGSGLRLISINGVPSHFSYVSGSPNNRGCIISPVGEFDPMYTPNVRGTNGEEAKILLYKYNGTIYCIDIRSITAPRIERIGRGIYKINTVGILNTIQEDTRSLAIGSDDYNSRALYTGALGTTRELRVFKHSGVYSSSVDPGEKAYYAGATVWPFAIETSAGASNSGAMYVDGYLAGSYNRTYVTSFGAGGAPGFGFVSPDKIGGLYLASSELPLPAGLVYDTRAAVNSDTSFIRVPERDEYTIGNKIRTVYDFFDLFGNLYAYSEGTIWLVPFNQSGFIQTLQPIAQCQALQLIATAPTMVYFLSIWDNSLYSFDGGRSLVKGVRLSQAPTIIKGEWNVAENSLTLDTASTIMFVRDGIVSQVPKNADMIAGVSFWSADDGVHLVGTANRYKYNYKPVGTVQPFEWRSSFFGLDANKSASFKEAVFTVYSATRAANTLTLYSDLFDVDHYYTESREVTVYPDDYNSAGYVRVRLQPVNQQGLAFSVGLSCSSKITLLGVAVEVDEAAVMPVSSLRSR